MDTAILAPWRDLAIVLLALEAAILLLFPLIALFLAVRGVRALKRWARQPLSRARVWMLRVQQGTARSCDAIVQVPIRLSGASARARVTARGLVDYLFSK